MIIKWPIKLLLASQKRRLTPTRKSHVFEIMGGNGYPGYGGIELVLEQRRDGSIQFQDITITATGGPIGPFQYIVRYDANDVILACQDYSHAMTLHEAEKFMICF